MYGVNVKDSGMLGLGMQKYVHAWANPEAESVKSSVVGERRLLVRGVYRGVHQPAGFLSLGRLLACGVYRDICGGVCVILPPETRQQHAVMSLRH
ncbi:hypothetical protein HMPREF1324_2053 [Rothia aeria F0474]|uniref:Uncharacterized protein n=1 Tax=Rothia aeria F0474 TaxID=1125724 RepID=I0UWK9_9MICC|nr:hypothetical protein HMPREF1324_2053 [Rothia aeria F0474]